MEHFSALNLGHDKKSKTQKIFFIFTEKQKSLINSLETDRVIRVT